MLIVMVSNKCCHLTRALEIRKLKMSKELRNPFLYWHLCIVSRTAMYLLQKEMISFSKEKKLD